MPMPINFLITSPALTPISRERSPTVITSEILMTRLLARGTVISVRRTSLPGMTRFLRGMPRPPRTSFSRDSSTSCFLTTRFLCRPAFGLSSPVPGSARGGCRAHRRAVVPGAGRRNTGVGAGSTRMVCFRSMRPRMRAPRGAVRCKASMVSGSGAAEVRARQPAVLPPARA